MRLVISKVLLRQKIITICFCLSLIVFLGAPVGALFYIGYDLPSDQSQNWHFILNKLVPDLFFNTIVLCLGSMISGCLLGSFLAVCIEHISSKWQRVFEILLTLPLAIPLYIYSFAYVGTFEWSSPVNTFIRGITLGAINSINIKNLFGAILIFTFALYPYVFLLVRVSLRGKWVQLYRSSLIMGVNPVKSWVMILKSLSIPAMSAGAIVIGMEALSEFGGTSFIGINTFTTAIYTSWSSFYSVEMASRLGLILVALIVPLIALENKAQVLLDDGVNNINKASSSLFSLIVIGITLLFTLVLPFSQMLYWIGTSEYGYEYKEVFILLGKTILMATIVTLLINLISYTKTVLLRRYNNIKLSNFLNYMFYGYAIPGNLIAIAFLGLGSFLWTNYSPKWAFSLMICALIVKFIRSSMKQMELGNQKISNEIEKTAILFSEEDSKKFHKSVYMPLMLPSIFYGTLLVGIEVVKELPLIMILRPSGYDTLSTKVYEFTSEGEWELACMYALPLVLTCIIFHIIISSRVKAS